MTDIRKDFETWAVRQKLPTNISDSITNRGAYAHQDTQVAFLGFQAGRAHDVDGLIAAVREHEWIFQADETEAVYVEDVVMVIRKHFGKE